jgi:hypothetical protein
MHPPAFWVSHHLSDWPECRLELNCCRGQVVIPVRGLLMCQHGDPTFATILARLRCQSCKGNPCLRFSCVHAVVNIPAGRRLTQQFSWCRGVCNSNSNKMHHVAPYIYQLPHEATNGNMELQFKG